MDGEPNFSVGKPAEPNFGVGKPPEDLHLRPVENQGRPDVAATMKATMDKLEAANKTRYGGKLFARVFGGIPALGAFVFNTPLGEDSDPSVAEFLVVTEQGFELLSNRENKEPAGEFVNRVQGRIENIQRGNFHPSDGFISDINSVKIGGAILTLSGTTPDPEKVAKIVQLNKDRVEKDLDDKRKADEEAIARNQNTIESARRIDELLG